MRCLGRERAVLALGGRFAVWPRFQCDERAGVFLRQALGGTAATVADGRLVPAHADDRDPVERGVGLPVASAQQAVPVRDPA